RVSCAWIRLIGYGTTLSWKGQLILPRHLAPLLAAWERSFLMHTPAAGVGRRRLAPRDSPDTLAGPCRSDPPCPSCSPADCFRPPGLPISARRSRRSPPTT